MQLHPQTDLFALQHFNPGLDIREVLTWCQYGLPHVLVSDATMSLAWHCEWGTIDKPTYSVNKR